MTGFRSRWAVGMVLSLCFPTVLLADGGAGSGTSCVGRVLNPETEAHFQRDGNAYLAGPDGMHIYPANEMRRKTELSCSAGQVEVLTGELGGQDAIPWCVTSAGLWATTNGTLGVWRSDGTSWTHVGDVAQVDEGRSSWLASLFALGSGRLIAFYSIDGVWHACWSENGSTWTEAAVGGTLRGAPYYIHNFCEAPNGTLVAVTYAGVEPGTLKQIWRSTDGATWVLAWEGGIGQFNHFHSVVYHQGTHRWITDTGDEATAYRHTFTSTDDGKTWHEWWEEFMPPMPNHSSPTGQVTCFRDPDDRQRVFLGSDGNQRVGWFDLTTWRAGTFMERQFTNRGKDTFDAYVFDLSQFDSVWYATLMSWAQSRETPVVLASTDLNRWAVCGRLESDNTYHRTLGYCAGRFNDALHYIVSNDDGHLLHARVPLVKVAEVNGVCVSSVKANLLNEGESRCNNTYDWEAGPAPRLFEMDSSTPFFAGTSSLHVKKTVLPQNLWVETWGNRLRRFPQTPSWGFFPLLGLRSDTSAKPAPRISAASAGPDRGRIAGFPAAERLAEGRAGRKSTHEFC